MPLVKVRSNKLFKRCVDLVDHVYLHPFANMEKGFHISHSQAKYLTIVYSEFIIRLIKSKDGQTYLHIYTKVSK